MNWNYIISRGLQAIYVIAALSVFVFVLVRLSPGDPALARLGIGAGSIVTHEKYEIERKLLGLDKPITVQYLIWVRNLATGDMGIAYASKKPIVWLVPRKFMKTLPLAASGLFLGIAIAIPLGIIAGTRPFTWADNIISTVSLFGIAAPSFWIGLMLMLLFGVYLGWFPTFGSGPPGTDSIHIQYLILPAITVAVQLVGSQARFMRSAMLEVMSSDYIRTARSKGLTESTVVLRHGLKNALLPVVTIIGLDFAAVLGSSVVTETVFRWPGMGPLLVEAIGDRDYGLIQVLVMFIGLIYITFNLAVDITYGLLDPRIRYR